MTDLFEFWGEEPSPRTKRSTRRSLKPGVLLLTLFALLIFYLGRSSLRLFPEKPLPVDVKKLSKLPEIVLPTINLKNTDNTTATSSPRLKIISAVPVAIVESLPTPSLSSPSATASPSGAALLSPSQTASASSPLARLVGLRILGEYQNIGTTPIEIVEPIIRFFDQKDQEIGAKLASETEGFKFRLLKPQEISVYDVMLPAIPPAAKAIIEMNPKIDQNVHENLALSVKIKDAKFDSNPTKIEHTNLSVYTYKGKFINLDTQSVSHIVLYAWVKNAQNKVIALGVKEFPYDVVSPNQELEFALPIIQIIKDTAESHEIKLWAQYQ